MERPLKAMEQQSLYVTQALVSGLQSMRAASQGPRETPEGNFVPSTAEKNEIQKLPVTSLPLLFTTWALQGTLGSRECGT